MRIRLPISTPDRSAFEGYSPIGTIPHFCFGVSQSLWDVPFDSGSKVRITEQWWTSTQRFGGLYPLNRFTFLPGSKPFPNIIFLAVTISERSFSRLVVTFPHRLFRIRMFQGR
jgi:hypothetical protein